MSQLTSSMIIKFGIVSPFTINLEGNNDHSIHIIYGGRDCQGFQTSHIR
jgi:hypothetical protein